MTSEKLATLLRPAAMLSVLLSDSSLTSPRCDVSLHLYCTVLGEFAGTTELPCTAMGLPWHCHAIDGIVMARGRTVGRLLCKTSSLFLIS